MVRTENLLLKAAKTLRYALPLGLRAELSAGDALYLPRHWWHAVSAPSGQLNVSLSYWTQPVEAGDFVT